VSGLDYTILVVTMLGIAAYGIWRTKAGGDLNAYIKGAGETRWLTIGLSVMATQASAITFLSTPGQGYESGLGFVQNYFGAPLALIIVVIARLEPDDRGRGSGRRRGTVGGGRPGALGGFQVDDVAQQHPPGLELVVPRNDRLERQRAFAQPADHHVAPGLDALGDGDLALARQQLDAAHLAQVHANRIVGAAEACLIHIAGRFFLFRLFGFFDLDRRGFAVLGFLALDDLDAHLVEVGHHVFDLLRAVLLGRQDGVQLVEGDVATLLAARDQPLHGGGLHVEQCGLHILLCGDGLGGYAGLRRHR